MTTPDHNGRAPEGAAPHAGRGDKGLGLPPMSREKIADLLPRLASPENDDVLATVVAIRCALADDGLDLHNLAQVVAGEPACGSPERPTVSHVAGISGPAATPLAGDGDGASPARAGAPVASTALPPRRRDRSRPLPDHPLLDPEGTWREPSRVLRAVMADGWREPNGPGVLRGVNAAGRLDLFAAAAEWLAGTHPDPAVRAFVWEMAEAGEAIRRRDKKSDNRAIPLGRLLGLQPASGATAGTAISLARRNQLLRCARASAPAWREAPTKDAARAMIAAFDRYETGGWLADRSRKTAPAAEPTASWWRILKLDLSRPMPREKRLEQILDGIG